MAWCIVCFHWSSLQQYSQLILFNYAPVHIYLFFEYHTIFANDETAILAAKQCLTVMTTHSSTILKQRSMYSLLNFLTLTNVLYRTILLPLLFVSLHLLALASILFLRFILQKNNRKIFFCCFIISLFCSRCTLYRIKITICCSMLHSTISSIIICFWDLTAPLQLNSNLSYLDHYLTPQYHIPLCNISYLITFILSLLHLIC